jgi:hypothetical protein
MAGYIECPDCGADITGKQPMHVCPAATTPVHYASVKILINGLRMDPRELPQNVKDLKDRLRRELDVLLSEGVTGTVTLEVQKPYGLDGTFIGENNLDQEDLGWLPRT